MQPWLTRTTFQADSAGFKRLHERSSLHANAHTLGRTRHNPGGRTGVMSGMPLRGSVGMPAGCPYRDHRRAVAPARPAPCPWERLRPIRKNRPSSSNATPNGTSRLRETQANVGCPPCDTPSRSTVGAVGVAAECERARWARVSRSTVALATSAPRHLSCGGTSGSRGRKGNPHVVDLGTHRHRLDRHRGRRIRRPQPCEPEPGAERPQRLPQDHPPRQGCTPLTGARSGPLTPYS